MNDHTTEQTTNEIVYGYCRCGCGQKTNLATDSDKRKGWVKGEPLRYIFGHQHLGNHAIPTESNPDGLCLCGCGQKTSIPRVTDRKRGWVKGQPVRYKVGHDKRRHVPPAPDFCACGCGQPLKKSKSPSTHARFISGHNNRQSVKSRFWERVNKLDPDECWNWTAGVGSHGYGTISVNGYPHTTHRLTWELTSGPIPDNLHVLHRCDNKLCCNPNHLFLGTNLDNIQDMVAKGRQAKGADKPDQKGENCPTAILTAEQVTEIRRRCAAGESQKELARIFGVSQGHISNLHRRVSWKHI